MNFTSLYNLAESKLSNISQENYAPLLSPETRKKAIFFFKRYGNGNEDSNKLNWQNHKNFIDSDFKFLDKYIAKDENGEFYFTQKSKSEIKKEINRERFNVDKSAEDLFIDKPEENILFHIYPEISNEDWLFVSPLTYEAAVYMDSRECGLGGACWCIGWRENSRYWKDHTEDGSKFVLAFNKKFRTLENTKIDGVPFLEVKDKNGNPVVPSTINKWDFSYVQGNGNGISRGDPCTYQDLFTKFMIQVKFNDIKVWTQPNMEFSLSGVQSKFGINFGVTEEDIRNLNFKEFRTYNDPEYKKLLLKVEHLKSVGIIVDEDGSEATIPAGATEVEDFTFSECTNLRKVTIPDSVTQIGKKAFDSCKNLKYIKIPENVTKIGVGAFEGCYGIKNLELPKNLKEIGMSAFYVCIGLSHVDIPYGVEKISNYTFFYCSGLKSVNLPDSIKEIGESAFGSCENLESIYIPDSVEGIGRYAFHGCNSLKTISIPADLDVSESGIPETCEINRRGSSGDLEESKISLFNNIYNRFN